MILKSSERENPKQLEEHISSDENEEVLIIGSDGIICPDSIAGALAEMEAYSKASRCTKYLYHVSASPDPDQELSEKQWKRIWKLYDKVHGLKGLPYIEVQHKKNNRIHRHRVYLRINPMTGKAVNLSWTRIKNERIARQLEVELGHKIIQGKHNKSVIRALKRDGHHDIAEKIAFTAKAEPAIADMNHTEWQQNKREKTLDEIREDLSRSWDKSTDINSFSIELMKKGYAIAQGDKVAVAVNAFDREYPLLRSINVIRKKENKPILRKTDLMERIPNNLPYVEAVRELATEYEWDKQNSRVSNSTSLEVLDAQINEYMNNIPSFSIPTRTIQKRKSKPTQSVVESPVNANSIQPTPQIRHQWILYRERLLLAQYQAIDLVPLAKYWKISERKDGSIRFNNRLGNIIDHGNMISTDCKHHTASTEVMISLAIAKKWHTINVNGSEEFKLAVYKEAIKNNIDCEIDTDEDHDLWLLARKEYAKKASTLYQ